MYCGPNPLDGICTRLKFCGPSPEHPGEGYFSVALQHQELLNAIG